mmetsp:Transcript_27824/g.60881  ORF Transcript_27824/g.60881 Transcript_27824/m.60881 type:complete len:213 (+) Transcript_27824:3-641(+)
MHPLSEAAVQFADRVEQLVATLASEVGIGVDELNEEEAVRASPFVSCPYDRRHRLPAECLEKHVEVCSSSGQTEAHEQHQPGFFYEDCPNVVSLHSEMEAERPLSRSEQYEQDVASAKLTRYKRSRTLPVSDRVLSSSFVQDISGGEARTSPEERRQSHRQLLQCERDVKRRKQKYTGKRQKRTPRLVLQQYIETRMSLLGAEHRVVDNRTK